MPGGGWAENREQPFELLWIVILVTLQVVRSQTPAVLCNKNELCEALQAWLSYPDGVLYEPNASPCIG